MYRKLYNFMYHVIDTCYGQNFGLEDVTEDSEILSLVLAGERQLDALGSQICRELHLHIYDSPLQAQDLEAMERQNLNVERFNIVMSLRYHNVRILLHRPILERILDNYAGSNSISGLHKSILQQIGIRNIEACVDSAKIIISAVYTVVLSSGWRGDLLGAWNYSLFYSKYLCSKNQSCVLLFVQTQSYILQLSTQGSFSLPLYWSHRQALKKILLNYLRPGDLSSVFPSSSTWRLRLCDILTVGTV